ncbi:MAG: type II toxin-antitoxin system RelE family toxin [Desulfurivibrionaceae bacterium]|jgi:mRNA interferase RelE/StbE|nr:hypothetical protein [Desulfobulbaceae bacterium]
MAWKVEFDPTAERDLNRLDPQHARKILTFLSERIAKDEDPRRFGAPLRSNFPGEARERALAFFVKNEAAFEGR